jgi:lipopolysaccharide transport system ATP-binding protein
MYVRLAFAVAAHLEHEILIVDEVLAVGDMEFQKKCLGKMSEVARGGRTVLFVSHNMSTIEALCVRCLLMEGGHAVKDGSPLEVIAQYTRSGTRGRGAVIDLLNASRRGSGTARIRSLRLLDGRGLPLEKVGLGETVQFEVDFACSQAIRAPSFGIVFHTLEGRRVLRVQSSEMTAGLPPCKKGGKVICRIEEILLAPGPYILSLGMANAEVENIDYLENCAEFEVQPANVYGTGRLPNQAASAFVAKGNWVFDYE